MKAFRLASASAAMVVAIVGTADAVDISGVDVVSLGRSHCAMPNPLPFAHSGGTYYPSLTGSIPGLATDPYLPWPHLAGHPYSAVLGSPGAPGTVTYRFDTPQQYFTVIDGTTDDTDEVRFLSKGRVLGGVFGYELINNFGTAQSLSLRFHLPFHATFDEVRLSTEGTSLEFANVNAICK